MGEGHAPRTSVTATDLTGDSRRDRGERRAGGLAPVARCGGVGVNFGRVVLLASKMCRFRT